MNVIGKAILNWEKYTEYVQRETINVKEHPEDSIWIFAIKYHMKWNPLSGAACGKSVNLKMAQSQFQRKKSLKK